MKIDKYRALFIKEVKDYLKEIYSHLEFLEKSFDKERVMEMERQFHTIKGMASTMGYREVAEIAHKVEDLLKEVFDRGEMGAEIYMRVVSASDSIMQFIAKLERGEEGDVKEREEVKEKKVFRIRVKADSTCTLPGPRYFVIYKNFSNIGEIRNPHPPIEEFKKGYKGVFEFICETDKCEIKEIEKILERESDLEWFQVEEVKEKEERSKAPLSIEERLVEELFSDLVKIGERITKIEYISNVKGIDELSYEASSLAIQFRGFFSKFMSLRMVPLSEVFVHVPAVVRSTAASTGKKVDLEFEGGDIVVDKHVASLLSDPVLHILRNAVDHGIEPPEERRQKGKPESGKIRFICEEKGGNIIITIEDDGRGIDKERVKLIALEKGLISKDRLKVISDDEIYSLITLPGFSTKEGVTSVSGRGVGMDIVRNVVEKLGGKLKIESEEGKFTKIVLSFPVSVSLTDVFMFEVDGYNFGTFPSFVERVLASDGYSQEYDGVLFDDTLYPVYRFSPFHGMKKAKGEEIKYLILCKRNESRFALSVDRVRGVVRMFLNLATFPLNMMPGIVGTCVDEVGNLCIVINPFELRRLL